MGIKSVDWFRSYLPFTCYFWCPSSNYFRSSSFLCYINDMELSISSEFKLLLYADDSAILNSNEDSRVISEKLGLELEMCRKWLIDVKLSLHMGKTECIIFGC